MTGICSGGYMRTWLRVLLTFFAVVAAFYFVFWVGGALVFFSLPSSVSGTVAFAVSLLVAVLVGRCVWMQTGTTRDGLFRFVVLGAVLVGTAGFLAGFIGPLLFAPHANQGPLLGLFVTGPLGFVLGGMGGGVYWLMRRNRAES